MISGVIKLTHTILWRTKNVFHFGYKRGNTVIHILKTLCKIKIARVPQPVFFRGSNGVKDFYIHAGNATRMLDSRETPEYIRMHLEA